MKFPISFLLVVLFPLSTFALREVRVEFDEEDRLVLLVNDTSLLPQEEEDVSKPSPGSASRLRQRQLRRDEGIVLDSSVARGGVMNWWSQQTGSVVSFLGKDSSWNRPRTSSTTTTVQQPATSTRSHTNPNVYSYVPPPVQPQRTNYQQYHAPPQQHHYQQYYTPPQQQHYYKPPPAGFQSAPQQRNSYYSPPQQQQIAHGQQRIDPPNSGGITLSRVVSDTSILQGAGGRRHHFQYMNPDYPMCWPRGDQPLDLYRTDTCCFLCRSGHNPTKPTRGVVVGANVHMEYTGTCTGLHEHMRNTKLTMGDTMCKITQTTFAEYCCAGELELSTNMGTWTVK